MDSRSRLGTGNPKLPCNARNPGCPKPGVPAAYDNLPSQSSFQLTFEILVQR